MSEIKPRIEGRIIRRDGQVSRFMILADSSSQWGLRSDYLGETSDVVSEMATAAQTATDFFAVVEDGDRLVKAERIDEFRGLLVKANQAAHGDSNDEEIEALQDALEAACEALGVDKDEEE
ncbi:hypothetical protein SEA_SONALI_62 [Arthrobacter phage Sonali]|uniref:Uncharacterized protein n=1 Tax=Arthrobacter phage Sonali TaxID=2510495 RepID=A0A411CQH8_9CAUD|nr:hypothetical protein HOV09_gp62 [Arthrobacter phage Sonali]QAY16174.1 hypothetical protein SEA_SONALI_62 [Arthrobacter phage Sonali]